jgi:hypothetical protein
MNLVQVDAGALWREIVAIGRDQQSDVLALCCTACERDLVYVRVRGDGGIASFVSKWFGCDCVPERRMLTASEASEIVKRRFDTEAQVHLGSWGDKT